MSLRTAFGLLMITFIVGCLGMRSLVLALLMLAFTSVFAFASGKIAWGSRVGMTVTVIHMSGLSTSNASRFQECCNGLSWTLDRDIAICFSKRFARNNDQVYLASGELDAPDILAYFSRRSESEVISQNVSGISVARIIA